MLLSLSNKIAFWSLVEEGKLILHLTFKDPGPKKINYEALSEESKKIVDKALENGHITQGQVSDSE
jgi:hypothetical protein